MKFAVRPFYGWGWFDGERPIDVPQPFEFSAEVTPGDPFGVALGKLEMADHPLSGKWIMLSPRHTPYDGDCNLTASVEKPDTTKPLMANAISGFASVANTD